MRLPKLSYTNFKKEYGYGGYGLLPRFKKLWRGKLWFVNWRQHEICIDWRENALKDLLGEKGWKRFSMYFWSWRNRN